MPAGGKREGAGRKKGVQNKINIDTREAFKHLVEDNTEKLAETNPVKAIELVTNLAEYVLPKLSRSEFVGEVKVDATIDTTKYTDEELKTISEIRNKNK